MMFQVLYNRSKKTVLPFCAVIGLAFLCLSCDDDDDGTVLPEPTSANVEVQDFMWKSLNEWYFWQADVEDLSDNAFASDEEYTEFLEQTPDPEDFIESLLFTEDRFTFYDDDYNDLLNSLSGVSKSDGIQFFIIDLTADDTNNLFGFVRNVVPGSTGAAAGIQRGDIVYGVNGQVLTPDNYLDLLFGDIDSYTLNMGEANVEERLVNQTDEEIFLTRMENFQENPIRLATTLEVNNQKIGYLMYRQFNSDFNDELNDVFEQFVEDGVTDLVLDMRYNGGGSVNTSRLLASMIYGPNTNDLYIRQRWNDKKQSEFTDAQLEDYFADQVRNGVSLNSLRLNRVYVLTTGSTASASELVINGLDPYINVIQIGTTTTGKNEFSISLVDDPGNDYVYSSSREDNINPDNSWIIQPLVGRNENSVGFLDYTEGFAPDFELREDVFNLGVFGDINEPLLAIAIEEITGISSKQAPSSFQQEPALYRTYTTPGRDLMILDKSLNVE